MPKRLRCALANLKDYSNMAKFVDESTFFCPPRGSLETAEQNIFYFNRRSGEKKDTNPIKFPS